MYLEFHRRKYYEQWHTEENMTIHTNCFSEFGLLKLDDINIYCGALFVYKSLNNIIESNMLNIRFSDRYNMRNNLTNVLDIPLKLTQQSQSFIGYHGVKIWNDLPFNVRQMHTLDRFKQSLKIYLLNKYTNQ